MKGAKDYAILMNRNDNILPSLISARVGLDAQHTSPNEDDASSAGSSMISLNPADITNSPKLRAVKLHRGQDGESLTFFMVYT